MSDLAAQAVALMSLRRKGELRLCLTRRETGAAATCESPEIVERRNGYPKRDDQRRAYRMEDAYTQHRFVGKVALVTGARSGIGRAASLQLGLEGAFVVAADVNEPAAQQTAD